MAGTPELRSALSNRALSAERKKALVAALWTTERASELLRRLLQLLAERDRLTLLAPLAEQYRLMFLAQENVASVEVVTATSLDAAQNEAVAAALTTALGGKVDIQSRVDPALLGGVLVKVAGRHYDGSVRGRLKALRASLAGA